MQNGFGHGSQTGMFEDALRRLDNTRPVDIKDPFIGVGDNLLLVLEISPFNHTNHGPSAKALFEVIQSQTHQPGTRVVKIWNLVRAPKWPSQPSDADRFADFVRKLSGAPENQQVGQFCAALLRDQVQSQLARGMMIRGYGVDVTKDPKKPYVDVRWESVVQTQEQIKEHRARIEARSTPGVPAVTPATPPQPTATTPAAATSGPQTGGSLLSQIPGFNR